MSRLLEAFYENPRCGEVYNLGGGRGNSISVLEAIAAAEEATGKKMSYTYVDQNRAGDHICYISDLTKIKSHFPQWNISIGLPQIFSEIAAVAQG